MIKKLWAKMIKAGLEYSRPDMPAEVRATTEMERMFGNCTPAIVAFRIENGYVVRNVNTDPAYLGTAATGFFYCKDHAAIAEHIVSEAAQQRLGLDQHVSKDTAMKQASSQYGGGMAANPVPRSSRFQNYPNP